MLDGPAAGGSVAIWHYAYEPTGVNTPHAGLLTRTINVQGKVGMMDVFAGIGTTCIAPVQPAERCGFER